MHQTDLTLVVKSAARHCALQQQHSPCLIEHALHQTDPTLVVKSAARRRCSAATVNAKAMALECSRLYTRLMWWGATPCFSRVGRSRPSDVKLARFSPVTTSPCVLGCGLHRGTGWYACIHIKSGGFSAMNDKLMHANAMHTWIKLYARSHNERSCESRACGRYRAVTELSIELASGTGSLCLLGHAQEAP
eukprot:scaffold299591_cov22-Tisochrysis_lutea.AAC.3